MTKEEQLEIAIDHQPHLDEEITIMIKKAVNSNNVNDYLYRKKKDKEKRCPKN